MVYILKKTERRILLKNARILYGVLVFYSLCSLVGRRLGYDIMDYLSSSRVTHMTTTCNGHKSTVTRKMYKYIHIDHRFWFDVYRGGK